MSEQQIVHDPAHCPCRNRNCPRNKNCALCMANHHEKGGLTTCERLAQQQKG